MRPNSGWEGRTIRTLERAQGFPSLTGIVRYANLWSGGTTNRNEKDRGRESMS